jgi:murein L,D-transpeptidase YafK
LSKFFNRLGAFVVLSLVTLALAACSSFVKGGDNRHNIPLNAEMVQALRNISSTPGDGMVIRIFKQEEILEVWKKTANGTYRLFKTYEICSYSGDLGPKFKEGDRQSPEGFYTISPGLMHPKSNYYLAFNTGFPNKFDRAHGRTGSNLMVHGDCKSVGCYAMTDQGIAEIYALARESFKGGNPTFQLQIYPFRMTTANMAKHATSPHLEFWKNIKVGYEAFDINKVPPTWDVCEGRYIFNPKSSGPLEALGACPPTSLSDAVKSKVAADEAALQKFIDTQLTAAQRAAATEAALKQRSEAINGFVSGIGSAIGLGNPGQNPNIAPIFTGKPATLPTSISQRP